MRYLYLAALLAFPAAAEEWLPIQKQVGFYLVMTRQCAHVTGDDGPYQRALDGAPARLVAGGMSPGAARDWLEETRPKIDALGPGGETVAGPIDICRNLLPTIERGLAEHRPE